MCKYKSTFSVAVHVIFSNIVCIQDEDEAAGVAGGGAEEVGSN